MYVVDDNFPATNPKSEEEVIDLVSQDERYLKQAILFLFDRQEDDDKARNRTIHRNRVGFNSADAGTFTPMAERLRSGQPLSSAELETCRKPTKKGTPRLAQYWRQLLKARNERIQ